MVHHGPAGRPILAPCGCGVRRPASRGRAPDPSTGVASVPDRPHEVKGRFRRLNLLHPRPQAWRWRLRKCRAAESRSRPTACSGSGPGAPKSCLPTIARLEATAQIHRGFAMKACPFVSIGSPPAAPTFRNVLRANPGCRAGVRYRAKVRLPVATSAMAQIRSRLNHARRSSATPNCFWGGHPRRSGRSLRSDSSTHLCPDLLALPAR